MGVEDTDATSVKEGGCNPAQILSFLKRLRACNSKHRHAGSTHAHGDNARRIDEQQAVPRLELQVPLTAHLDNTFKSPVVDKWFFHVPGDENVYFRGKHSFQLLCFRIDLLLLSLLFILHRRPVHRHRYVANQALLLVTKDLSVAGDVTLQQAVPILQALVALVLFSRGRIGSPRALLEQASAPTNRAEHQADRQDNS